MFRAVGARLAVLGADMGAAFRLRPVRIGLLGTILLALGSLSPAYLPQASPYWPTMRALGLDTWLARALATVMVIGAVGLLIFAWYRLRPAVYRDVKHWAVLAWWSLPLLFAPPIFSHDAYSYAAQGWLIHNGLNPYEVSPSVLPGPFADQVAWLWRYTPAPYGPLGLQISHWLVDLAGLNPYYSAVLQRLPALVGVGLIVHLLPRIARQMGLDPRRTAWFATINPLMVIDLVGGAHNDALMLGLVVLAIWCAYRGWFWVAILAVGVAMAVKQPALLAAVPVAVIGSGWASWRLRDVLRFLPRALLVLAGVVGVFAGISALTGLGFGWINAINVPGMVDTVSPFTVVGHIIQYPVNLITGDMEGRAVVVAFKTIGSVFAVLGIVWFAIRHLGKRPLHFVSYSFIWFALCAPAIHSWYLLWGAVLLPMTKPSTRALRAAIMFTVFLLGFNAMNFGLRNGMWLMVFVLFGVSYWIVHTHELSQPMEKPDSIPAERGPAVPDAPKHA